MKLEVGKFYKINKLAVGEKKFMYIGMTITDKSYTFYEFLADKAVINGDFMLSINNIDCVEEWQEPQRPGETINYRVFDKENWEKETKAYCHQSEKINYLQQQIDELKEVTKQHDTAMHSLNRWSMDHKERIDKIESSKS